MRAARAAHRGWFRNGRCISVRAGPMRPPSCRCARSCSNATYRSMSIGRP